MKKIIKEKGYNKNLQKVVGTFILVFLMYSTQLFAGERGACYIRAQFPAIADTDIIDAAAATMCFSDLTKSQCSSKCAELKGKYLFALYVIIIAHKPGAACKDALSRL